MKDEFRKTYFPYLWKAPIRWSSLQMRDWLNANIGPRLVTNEEQSLPGTRWTIVRIHRTRCYGFCNYEDLIFVKLNFE